MHPLRSPNPDHGCKWLCETAGIRSAGDEAILAEVLSEMPFEAKPLIIPHHGINLWDLED
jgi:hypothetical protein